MAQFSCKTLGTFFSTTLDVVTSAVKYLTSRSALESGRSVMFQRRCGDPWMCVAETGRLCYPVLTVLQVPFEDGFGVMKDALDVDPGFKQFHEFCINNRIPFNVISAGLKPVLRRVLDHFLGEKQSAHIDIVANDATISKDGSSWKPEWLHDTELGHDKACLLYTSPSPRD